jgi:hypothetical protein
VALSRTVDLTSSKELSREITQCFGLERDAIEAILPCTPFQLDVIDCSSHDGRRAVGHAVYEIPNGVDTERLAAAWKDTVQCAPALRKCTFTSKSGECFQLVLRENFVFARIYWTSASLKSAIIRDEASAAIAGPRCNRFVILEDSNTKRQIFIWTFSNAFVDSASQERMLQQVLAAYKDGYGRVFSLPPTPDLVGSENGEDLRTPESEQAEGMQRAMQFSQEKLSGLDASVFPHLSSHL